MSTKTEAKFAAFGIRLDAEPMMKRRLRLVRWRHTMHPGIDVNKPGCDVTYSSLKSVKENQRTKWAGWQSRRATIRTDNVW